MIILVEKGTNRIISRYEAWAEGSYESAIHDIEANGFSYVSERITLNGDMVIFIEHCY